LLWRPKVKVAPEENPHLIENTDRSASSVTLDIHDHDQSTVNHKTPPADRQPPSSAMANFDVNPIPYTPTGFDLEHWARPGRGQMVLAGNPPRHHEVFAIATLTPAPHITICINSSKQ
jgi:hypothetical protein